MIQNKSKNIGGIDILICDCNSTEHQIVLAYEEDEHETTSGIIITPICYAQIHLSAKPFWKRVSYAFRYILGRKCRFGAWDEFLFKPDDAEKLQELVNYLKNTNENPSRRLDS